MGTRVSNIEWKKDIKKGDLIDINDTEGKWLLGTVLSAHYLEEKGFPELKVGYRVYREKGAKKDPEEKYYDGWSENYDELLPANSPRIQLYLKYDLY